MWLEIGQIKALSPGQGQYIVFALLHFTDTVCGLQMEG